MKNLINKFSISNSNYFNSAGKLLVDLQKNKNLFTGKKIEEYVNDGLRPSLAMIKANEDFENFKFEVLQDWLKVYKVDSVNHHWVMFNILLHQRRIYTETLKNRYVSDGMRSGLAAIKASDKAYDTFREDINKHIIYVPTSGGKNMKPLPDQSKKITSRRSKEDDAPDGEKDFFKSHYCGNSVALGY